MLGNVCLNGGDFEAAVAEFDQALRINPSDVRSYHNRGAANLRLHNYAGASADYAKTLDLDPTFHEQGTVWLFLAQANHALGQVSTSLQYLARADAWFAEAEKMSRPYRLDNASRERFEGVRQATVKAMNSTPPK
jgi:tetratricopeptide (TPR) repeat protein